MSGADYYESGDWNAMCYRCGGKFKASELHKYWAGFYLCSRCWNPRQPQDFVRSIPDNPSPPWTQPWPRDIYTAGEVIVTESSNSEFGPLIYIGTEAGTPITTET